ncbi:hypothetical protein B0A49_00976 [Cryomyces minteri]|uniref:DNA-directed RNA polymerase II subunit RPB9 n=1 Tax=Cryomyces minteri TaxID=331657 RepID=A0A4U0XLU8_9PEZI|nr:hypothetical protein B0A49_00976 [Cryomyces minteri]
MLYPKEDPTTNTLMFACLTCSFSEPAASSCVFRNELSNTVGETSGVTQDVASDPTVGAPSSSSSSSSAAASNSTPSLPPRQPPAACTMSVKTTAGPASREAPDMCTLCGCEIYCFVCGKETDNGMYLEVDDPEAPSLHEQDHGCGGDGGDYGYEDDDDEDDDDEDDDDGMMDLPRVPKKCPRRDCDGEEAVFFQSQQRTAETGMKLFFVCVNCGTVWS